MTYVRFWLRSPFDERPISALKQDTPFEVIDWQELPEGAGYGVWHLMPRDWHVPASAAAECLRLFNDKYVAKQVMGKRLAHLEVLTPEGVKVIMSDMPEEEPKQSLLKRLFAKLGKR